MLNLKFIKENGIVVSTEPISKSWFERNFIFLELGILANACGKCPLLMKCAADSLLSTKLLENGKVRVMASFVGSPSGQVSYPVETENGIMQRTIDLPNGCLVPGIEIAVK